MRVVLVLVAVVVLWSFFWKPTPRKYERGWTKATLLAKEPYASAVAVDGGEVYFLVGGHLATENAVKKVALSGGPVTTLAQGHSGSADKRGLWLTWSDLALDETSVYFSNPFSGTVMRVPRTGGEVVVVASGQGDCADLRVDDASLYWCVGGRRNPRAEVRRMPKGGGEVTILAEGQQGLGGLVVDARYVYWRTPRGVSRVEKGGGPVVSLLPNEAGATGDLAQDADFLYLPLRGEKANRFTLARVPKAGGEPVILGGEPSSVLGLAVDDAHVVFFGQKGFSGYTLGRVPKAGGTPVEIDGGTIPTGKLALVPGGVAFTDLSGVYLLPIP